MVPDGAPVHASGNVDPVPSQLYASGIVPPSATAELVRAKLLFVVMVSVVLLEEPLPLHALKKANAKINKILIVMFGNQRLPSLGAI